MPTEHWQSLIANFAVVALFISSWANGQFVFAGRPRWVRNAAFGLLMGAGCVVSMILAIQIDGALFDLRSTLVAVSAFFGGPLAAGIAVAIAIVYRGGVIGGPASLTAVAGIAACGLIGLSVSLITRRRARGLVAVVVLAAAVGTLNIVLSALVAQHLSAAAVAPSLPTAATNALATLTSAFFILRGRHLERERDLLRAAFAESPDFQYVKTRDFRFATVNMAAARLNGFDTPAQMAGLTDFDITSFERAKSLMLGEQRVLETGEPLVDFLEAVPGVDGEDVWYVTSKVALHNADGEIAGLAGVTRDVTARRRLQQEITDGRNRLNSILSGISDGVAMYDRQGTLAYCNEQFQTVFPLTAAVRRSGQHIRDILRSVAETGEQRGIPADDQEGWIDLVAGTLLQPGEQEVELFDGRWLHIRTRPTSDGSALVVVSDVTSMKQAEAALREMTGQLRQLATTDGLTGLANRRAFDQGFDNELLRTRRSNRPLSIFLSDVDRFKAYNDIYGHQAGDEVLKTVALCLRGAIKRPADIAARYGGEEFVAVLPETDADGAVFIADAFRQSLASLRVPHKGGDRGILTVSVGVATMTDGEELDAAGLLHRADEALYLAKGGGRDCAVAWRPPQAHGTTQRRA